MPLVALCGPAWEQKLGLYNSTPEWKELLWKDLHEKCAHWSSYKSTVSCNVNYVGHTVFPVRDKMKIYVSTSVADPEPDQEDPYVLGLSDLGTDLEKNLDSYCFVTSLWLFVFEKLSKCSLKSNKQKNIKILLVPVTPSWRSMTKIAGYGSGSVRQRYHISADPDSDQNVTLVSTEDKIPSRKKKKFISQSFSLPFKKTSQEV